MLVLVGAEARKLASPVAGRESPQDLRLIALAVHEVTFPPSPARLGTVATIPAISPTPWQESMTQKSRKWTSSANVSSQTCSGIEVRAVSPRARFVQRRTGARRFLHTRSLVSSAHDSNEDRGRVPLGQD